MWHQPCNNQIALQVHHFDGFSKTRYKRLQSLNQNHVMRAQRGCSKAGNNTIEKRSTATALSKTVAREQFSLSEADRIERVWKEHIF